MPSINLLPWRRRRLTQRIRLWSLLLAVQLAIAAVVITSDYLSARRQHVMLTQRIAQLKTTRQTYEATYQQFLQTTRQQGGEQAQQTFSEQGLRHNQRYLQLLMHLPQRMPEALWLTEISDGEQGLMLSGVSHHYQAIVDFSRRLAGKPLAARSELRQTRRHSKDTTLLTFTLQLSGVMSPHGVNHRGSMNQ